MKASFFLVLIIFSTSILAQIPQVTSRYETTPIPRGTDSTDDMAIWLHPFNSNLSLLLGVSKNKEEDGGHPGLGIYDLKGREKEFIAMERLNNIDVRYNIPVCRLCKMRTDIAMASNRDNNAMSIFNIDKHTRRVRRLPDISLADTGENEEMGPYGACLYHSMVTRKLYGFLPYKSGKVYQYEISLHLGQTRGELVRVFDLSSQVTAEQDTFIRELVWKDVVGDDVVTNPEDYEEEFQEELLTRYQLEGCVADEEYGTVYVGMELLGIWKLNAEDFSHNGAHLMAQVKRSKVDGFAPDETDIPRLTDDIEGMALYNLSLGQGMLVVSVQGISEFAVFDRFTNMYIGNFSIGASETIDAVTETDGLAILSTPMGEFRRGLMVVHDDANTQGQMLKRANYKLISLSDVWPIFPQLPQGPSTWNPRFLHL